MRPTIRRFVCGVLALCVALAANAALAEIEMVAVGNAGNAADTINGHGSVSYDYQIGKFEVMAGQYTAFLNSAAASDPYGLYNSNMVGTSQGSGISRNGSSGSYTYAVDSAFVNRPVNFVSWYDAARYTNWLTTGNTETGVYTFSGGTLQSIMEHQTAGATYGTAYFLPTEDEWYKAAYHKNDGPTGNYFLYPTSSDTPPGQDMADVSGNNANCYTSPYVYPIDSGKYTTVGGEFQNSDSPYGTFDQGGNVWEWNETLIDSGRGTRGGAFGTAPSMLASSFGSVSSPTLEGPLHGFRVASNEVVPEPGSIAMLLGLLGVGLLWWRRRR